MSTDTMLYAWARPLDIDPRLDHTWVTDYQPASSYADIGAVVKAFKNYWYCWGDFHTNDFRAIGHDGADETIAKCLVWPNDANSHGTIFRYAIDGVCHQLANQVLYSTGSQMVVSKANGYGISSFLYGPYGLTHSAWAHKIHVCTIAEAIPMDELETMLTKALDAHATPDAVEALKKLRAEFQASLQTKRPQTFVATAEDEAADLNDKITQFMHQAHELLGDEAFQAVFGIEMADTFKLVDPDMFAASEANYAAHLEAKDDE